MPFSLFRNMVLIVMMTCSPAFGASSSLAKPQFKPRPKWIHESHPFTVTKGFVISLGQTTTIPGAGTEEGFILAANQARETACKAIEHRVDFIFQDSEEGSSVDHKILKSMSAELCKWFSINSKRGQRYWEKVATTASNGDRIQVYRVFVTEVVRESDFQKAVNRIVKKEEKASTLPKGKSKEIQKRWNQFAAGE